MILHVFSGQGFFFLPLLVVSLCCLSLRPSVRLSIHLSVFPSLSLSVILLWATCVLPQRFEGFRNEKAMPQSLEPSCSSTADEGPVTTNHLRLVPNYLLLEDMWQRVSPQKVKLKVFKAKPPLTNCCCT